MRPFVPALALLSTLCASFPCTAPAAAQQTDTERFELRGRVINAATGEAVAGALVQIGEKTHFTSTDGTFVFTNLPRGQFDLTARKPGFFNEQELGRRSSGMNSMKTVPADGDVTLKLIPEGIIYGEVKNENGEPLSDLTVTVQRWQMADGQKRLSPAGNASTDDEGNFRIAELSPGTYYLSFQPNGGPVNFNKPGPANNEDEGYGLQFYPGVSDVSSASTIEVRPGVPVRVAQTMNWLRVFAIRGAVRGAGPESGINVMLLDSSGESTQRSIRINQKTGEFEIEKVPAGTYVLLATVYERNPDRSNESQPPLTAKLSVHVTSDVSGLVLPVGRGIPVTVQVRDEVSDSSGSTNIHQIMVQMIPKEFPQFRQGIVWPPFEGDRRSRPRFEGLLPGIYTVEVTPNGPWYVASLRCGGLDLLREDLTLAAGTPPIEATLRNDSAQLTVTPMKGGEPVESDVVIYSQEYPKRSLIVHNAGMGSVSMNNLAPGTYQVIALGDAEELEFRDPAVMQKYLHDAREITLQPGDDATVRVEVQDSGNQQ